MTEAFVLLDAVLDWIKEPGSHWAVIAACAVFVVSAVANLLRNLRGGRDV